MATFILRTRRLPSSRSTKTEIPGLSDRSVTRWAHTAEGLTEGEPEFDETEVLDVRKMPLTEALDMVNRGEITDAVSVAAILKVSK